MSDFLLQLGDNPQARKLIKTLGLPIPIPQKLRRALGPWEERPLADWNVAVGGAGELAPVIAKTLILAGADPHVTGELGVYRELGEAYGHPPVKLSIPGYGLRPSPPTGEAGSGPPATTSSSVDALPADLRLHGLIFDATTLTDTAGLRSLYDFFHPLVGALVACGRVIVIGRPPEAAATAAEAGARAALEGFVRSLAKELGKRGTTAQLLVVHAGAEGRVEPILRFLLSARSAFMTGQPIPITMIAKGFAEPPLVRPLEGKTALVTGAARGIGEATARLLHAEGAHVICLDRPADDGPLSQVAREIAGTALLCDVADDSAPQTVLAKVQGVDIVVHNAGVTRDKTLARMSPEAWDQTLGINLAAIQRLDAALASGALRDGGRVICLSSVAGIAGNVGQTNYAASKSGVIGWVRRRATELAPRGITVNAVAPGFIETRLTAAIPVMIREVGRRLSALGQGGLPRDVGDVITFLASPGAAGITGAALRVCGGALIGA